MLPFLFVEDYSIHVPGHVRRRGYNLLQALLAGRIFFHGVW